MNRRRFLAALGAVTATRRWRRFTVEQLDNEVSPARYPYVQNVQSNRATVSWATLEDGAGSFQYTADGIDFRSVAAKGRQFSPLETGLSASYFQYQADLTGLSPDT